MKNVKFKSQKFLSGLHTQTADSVVCWAKAHAQTEFSAVRDGDQFTLKTNSDGDLLAVEASVTITDGVSTIQISKHAEELVEDYTRRLMVLRDQLDSFITELES